MSRQLSGQPPQIVGDEKLTAELADRVMGWKVATDRFMKSGRSWIPRWRFQPFENLEDAFQVLDKAADCFFLTRPRRAIFIAEVQIGGRRGKASGDQKARAIATAVARALGMQV